ncbi:MAG TPA: glycosyltransferase family 39 protein [Ktedonobacteraceae bacterium]|nr:glycosyltransferase family 39 protein [Ktedonobacteraceae bacterium]
MSYPDVSQNQYQPHPEYRNQERPPREAPDQQRSLEVGESSKKHLTRSGQVLLLISLVTGAFAHGYNMLQYPLHVTDEGIYMEQAWSVLREGRLSPYTYFYDHAPAGWLVISGWISLLPFQFQTFGDAISTGRVLMLLVHIINIYLLFHITYRFSNSLLAAFIAAFFFNFSPLAVYYQRQVLLDNMMVFWLLLSIYLITRDDGRVMTLMMSGIAYGIGVVTKENAIFFLPAMGYLLYTQVRKHTNYRFSLGFWSYTALAMISLYFLYAALKNELLPANFDFDLSHSPSGHVSLLYSIWWQFHRSQGSIMDMNSYYWTIVRIWLFRDTFILVAGLVSMVINLFIGLQNRQQNRGYLIVALLAAGYAFYIARGSVVLEFYIVPLIPFLAMNLGMLASFILSPLRKSKEHMFSLAAQGVFAIALIGILISPTGKYFFVKDEFGKTVPHDLYKLPVTYMEREQEAFIRQHIPPNAKIIIDDELWVDLHDVAPYYKYAHSHWKAASDPDVRNKIFHNNWQDIDYIVMSNKMLQAMQLNNGDGSENYILQALQNSQRIWDLKRGDIELQIYQVQK